MSTLADINQVLQNQTSVLEDVASSTASTNSNLDRFIRAMQRKQDGDDLEAEREKGRTRLFQSQQQKSDNKPAPKSGMFDNIQFPAGFLTAAGLSQFGKSLLKSGLLRAVPIALATAFADDIESWVTSSTGSKEIGEAASRASIGGAFGLALGKRFGALGAIIGAVATKDNIEKFNDLGTALKERINGFLESVGTFVESDAAKGIRDTFEKLGIDITAIKDGLPSMETVLTALTTAVGDGLVAITGFVEGGFDDAKFQENWKQGVGLLAGVVLALKPLRKMVLGLARFALRTPLGRVITGIGLGTLAVTELFDGDDEFSESDLTAAIGLTLGAGAAAVAATRKLRANPGRGGAGGNTAATGSALGAPMTKSGRVVGEVFETKSGGRMKVMQNPKGGLYTQAVSNDTPLGKPSAKWWNKFPRIKALVPRAGPLAALMAVVDSFLVAQVMNNDSLTKDEKTSQVGNIIGGSIGGLAGLAIGGLIGGPLGAAILSTGGYFAGTYLGEKLANWLFGGSNQDGSPTNPMANLQGAGMGNYDFAFDDTSSPSVSRPKVSSGVAENQAMSSYYSNLAGAGMGSYGGDTNIGQVGDNPTYNTQSSPIVMTPGGAIKLSDIVTE